MSSGWAAAATAISQAASAAINLIQLVIQRNAIREASRNQAAAAEIARSIAEKYGDDALNYLAGYVDIGMAAANEYTDLVRGGYFDWDRTGYEVAQWQPAPFVFEAEPGYAFRLREGRRAIESSAAARGMGLSGATQKALINYSQQMASNEYQNAYRRWLAQRQQEFSEYTNIRNYVLDKWQASRAMQLNALRSGMSAGYAAAASQAATKRGTADTIASLALRRGDILAAQRAAMGNLANAALYNLATLGYNALQTGGTYLQGQQGYNGPLNQAKLDATQQSQYYQTDINAMNLPSYG